MPVEIDKKRAVFTYEQFFKMLRPNFVRIRCPYHGGTKSSLIMDLEKDTWYCIQCSFGGEVQWDESHIILKKVQI